MVLTKFEGISRAAKHLVALFISHTFSCKFAKKKRDKQMHRGPERCIGPVLAAKLIMKIKICL